MICQWNAWQRISRRAICGLLLGWVLGWSSVAVAGDLPRIASGQRQLFLDDVSISKIENLKRTLHQPQKRGAVIRSVNPTQTIQTRMAPLWDPGAQHYKQWVIGTDSPLRVSSDGLHWTAGPKPNMRIDHAVYDPHDADPMRHFSKRPADTGMGRVKSGESAGRCGLRRTLAWHAVVIGGERGRHGWLDGRRRA